MPSCEQFPTLHVCLDHRGVVQSCLRQYIAAQFRRSEKWRMSDIVDASKRIKNHQGSLHGIERPGSHLICQGLVLLCELLETSAREPIRDVFDWRFLFSKYVTLS